MAPVESLPSKLEILSSKPSTPQKKKKRLEVEVMYRF
jgi:hypothetical protein